MHGTENMRHISRLLLLAVSERNEVKREAYSAVVAAAAVVDGVARIQPAVQVVPSAAATEHCIIFPVFLAWPSVYPAPCHPAASDVILPQYIARTLLCHRLIQRVRCLSYCWLPLSCTQC